MRILQPKIWLTLTKNRENIVFGGIKNNEQNFDNKNTKTYQSKNIKDKKID